MCQTLYCSNCFERVLAVVDDALGSARDSKTKISGVTDNKFEEAVNELIDYDRVYHST